MAHFTNDFSTVIQIPWKFDLGVNPIYDIVSLQKNCTCHGSTAIVAYAKFCSDQFNTNWKAQNDISIEFELRWQNRS